MTPEFHRIRRLPPYVLEEVNRIKARLRAEGTDIIDFGMGNPDMPTPKHIVEKMIETARDPKAGRYSASKGIVGLRRAMAGYYKRRFGVTLNPDTEVMVVSYDPADAPDALLEEPLDLDDSPLALFFGGATFTVHHLDGTIARVAPAARTLLGHPANDLEGARWTDALLDAVLP
ncbi:MAG TPA: hypothetical protein PKB04_12585, partial [Phenylobacterium sp.]|nr:hypothetical protein [Phenylobacterium sp.]